MLVDNLVAIQPDHARHGAASGRPVVDDALLPVVDRRTRVGGLFVNAGHRPLGWTLATRSPRLLAAVSGGENPRLNGASSFHL